MTTDDAGHEALERAILHQLNVSMWSIEPRADEVCLKPFLDDLFRYARQFNMAQMGRDCGVSRNTMWRLFRRSKNMRFATLLRLCYYMGLRFRLEVDPLPRKLAYGSHHPDYVPQVDKRGAWPR